MKQKQKKKQEQKFSESMEVLKQILDTRGHAGTRIDSRAHADTCLHKR
jgi:hypothetical protein